MRRYIVVVSAVVVGVMLGVFFQPLISGDSLFQQTKKLDYVLNTVLKNYVDDVDSQKLVESAIKGMLNELDPHSVYISAEEMKRVEEDFQGSFEGIGIEFDLINDTITVVSPIPDGPSEKVGMQPGDKIIKIDGESAVGINRADVPKKLKGPKGTVVKLEIKRAHNPELLNFAITRDKIPLNSVDGSFIIDGTDIGVVIINRFSATTHNEMMQALKDLKSQGMRKLILDLRSNPGGYLNQAFLMADEFIPRGDTIVYTKGRLPQFDEAYLADGGQEFEKLPLVVLVNAGSASASEIVSGSIQDLDRGLVVGETSYGKGLVQRQFEVGDGSAFRLTISKYYTPSGRSIQRPYQDKDKYRHLAGRLELEEGSYIHNAVDKIKAEVRELNAKATKPEEKFDIDSLPLFKTKSGRYVFGGGGITPDYIVKSDTVTKLTVDIRRKNLFFEFVNDYLSGEGKDIKTKYASDFTGFLRNFNVTEAMMQKFRKLVESKDIKWDDANYKTDKDYLELAIKSTIARSLWDRNKFMQVFSVSDKQIMKAVELFPEAMKLAKLK